jgi:hypothetical protein
MTQNAFHIASDLGRYFQPGRMESKPLAFSCPNAETCKNAEGLINKALNYVSNIHATGSYEGFIFINN